MAGFKPQRKLYKLKFTDEEYEGLEVLASSTSMGTMLAVQELAEKLGDKPTAAESLDLTKRLIEIFCGSVKEWNLVDDDDQPLPVSVQSLNDQDPDFVLAMVMAWTEAVAGVSAPLAGGSPSGETSLEAGLPMDVLSVNPVS